MHEVKFLYVNHKGQRRMRRVGGALSLDFQRSPGYGHQPGWFLSGMDLDKNEPRSFALSHIVLNAVGSVGQLDRYPLTVTGSIF